MATPRHRPSRCSAVRVTAVAGRSRLVIVVPYLWLLFFFLVPFVIVFKISLSQTAIAMPPYTPVLDLRRRHWRAHGAASANSPSTTTSG